MKNNRYHLICMVMKFILLFFQLLAIACISAHPFLRYVAPSNASTADCSDHLIPCFTVGQFTGMADRYFITGSVFLFLAGNHSLQDEIYLADASNITLMGHGNGSTVRISLADTAIIVCDNASNIRIEGLTFVLCQHHCKERSALLLMNSEQIIISNSTFRGNGMAKARSAYLTNSNVTVINCCFEGNRGFNGGALEAWSNSTIHISWSTFVGNNATSLGGAINLHDSGAVISYGNTFSRNRAEHSGGSITANHNSTIILEGIFSHNSAGFSGGAIHCGGCTLTMRGNSTFRNNRLSSNRTEWIGLLYTMADVKMYLGGIGRAESGGAIALMGNGTLILDSGIAVFSSNKAKHGGAIGLFLSELSCSSGGATIILDGNRAEKYGGGLHIWRSQVQTDGCDVFFQRNTALEIGGGISIGDAAVHESASEHVVLSGNFTDNLATMGSALSVKNQNNVLLRYANIVSNSNNAICTFDSIITFRVTTFVKNSGVMGGSIYSVNSRLYFEDSTLFAKNKAGGGGAIYLLRGRASFDGVTIFTNNSAWESGGALLAIGAVVDLNGALNFTFNSAPNGGAVYLEDRSFMTLSQSVHLNSSFNAAHEYGGGIYHVDDTDPAQCGSVFSELSHCALKIREENQFTDVSISSFHDSAGIDGSFLYGGLLDRCRVSRDHNPLSLDHGETMLHYLTNNFVKMMLGESILTVVADSNTSQGITSQPYGLCVCNGSDRSQECARSKGFVIHRGQTFTVPLFAIAQGDSFASTMVTAITSHTASLKLMQSPQHLPPYCSNLTFNLYSTEENEKLTLYPEGPCHDTGNAKVTITLVLLPCPHGFIPASDGHCECDQRLHMFEVTCAIEEDFYYTRKAIAGFWMGADFINGSCEGLVLYKTCPVEYCTTDETNMTLHDLDVQCVPGRVGVLCGGCAPQYSLMIGSSRCKQCSNTNLVLILPFAAAGILLVMFLSVLRLTVATGIMNSLILYANIVQVNKRLFFPAYTTNILTIFIAWLNLDLGFETCFYDGMDAFTQTWLQFAFPVYVWVLISLMIITSRYSITISKLIGHNPIAVLATLLLMSYTKILKIIIEVYSSVKLDYPRNVTTTVWLKDANVPYLQTKHLILTVVTTLLLIFLFLPYTLLLLLGHKFYRLSGRKYFRWVMTRLKPLLDSYYAPYKIHTRYWTGFLLLVRCILYVVFSFNSLGRMRQSHLAIIITFTAVGFAVGSMRIYSRFSISILEASAYLNLVSLSALSLAEVDCKRVLVDMLVAEVFIVTIGVILYHFYATYLEKSVIMSKLKGTVTSFFQKCTNTAEGSTAVHTCAPSRHNPHKIVSKTVIELREPLLETSLF